MQPHFEERTDAATPAHLTAGRSAARGHTVLPERIDVQQVRIDVEWMPGTSRTPRPRRDWLAAPRDNPDVRDPRLFPDKKSEFQTALPARLNSALADCHEADFREMEPDFGIHSTKKPATTKRQEPALTDETSPTVSNVKSSWVS